MRERDKLFLSAHAILSRLFHTLRMEMNTDDRRLIDEAMMNSSVVFELSSYPFSGGRFLICDRRGVSARVSFDIAPNGNSLDVTIHENAQ
jgi:hypothetical protein